MGVVIPVDSELGRELAKWEQFPSERTNPANPPGNPYVYRPFPKMVYRGGTVHGKIGIADQKIAKSDSELAILIGQGYVLGPDKAIEQAQKERDQRAHAAAELEYEKVHRLHSDAARAEVERAQDATHEHISHVPPTPIKKKPGRPATAAPVAATE